MDKFFNPQSGTFATETIHATDKMYLNGELYPTGPDNTIDVVGNLIVRGNFILDGSIQAAALNADIINGITNINDIVLAGISIINGKIPISALEEQPIVMKGCWDADLNDPTLADGVGNNGDYYIVCAAGNTLLDGNDNWAVGDALIFNGDTTSWVQLTSIVTLTSTGGDHSLVVNDTGPPLTIKGLTAGTNITLTPSGTDLSIIRTAAAGETLMSAGGTETIVNAGTGPEFKTKGLIASTGISLTSTGTSITVNNSSFPATIALTSTGGTSLVSDGTGPGLALKGLTAGANMSLSAGASSLTLNNTDPASGMSLMTAGGDETLVVTGSGASLAIKDIVVGTGMSLSVGASALTITNTDLASANVALTSAGGTSLVVDGSGESLSVKGITAGVGMGLSAGVSAITINNADPASGMSLMSTGGDETLVVDGSGASLAIKDLVVGTGMSLSVGATVLTINNTDLASDIALTSAGGDETLVVDGSGESLSVKGITAGAGISFVTNANDIVISVDSGTVDSATGSGNVSGESDVTFIGANGTGNLLDGTSDGFTKTFIKSVASSSFNGWDRVETGVQLNNQVRSMAFHPTTGELYIGGSFTGLNGANYIARFDGTNWVSIASNAINRSVSAIAFSGTTLWSSCDSIPNPPSQASGNVWKLQALVANVWSSRGFGTVASGSGNPLTYDIYRWNVHKILPPYVAGDIYVDRNDNGNIDTNVGKIAGYALIDGDNALSGQQETPTRYMNGVSGSTNPTIYDICDTLVVGNFQVTDIDDDQMTENIGYLDSGNAPTTFGGNNWNDLIKPGDSNGSKIYACAKSGAVIYAGGDFTHYRQTVLFGPTISLPYLGYWSGAAWSQPWVTNPNGIVYSMTLHSGRLYITGDFTNLGGGAGIVSWAINGSGGNDWVAEPGTASLTVTGTADIEFNVSNEIHIGGNFTGLGTNSANYVAHYKSIVSNYVLTYNGAPTTTFSDVGDGKKYVWSNALNDWIALTDV